MLSPTLGLSLLLCVAGCSHREESPPADSSNVASSELDKGTRHRDFMAVLIVEPHGPDLVVSSSAKVTAKSLGKAATARGNGDYVVGWALRAKTGELVASGEIATAGGVGAPPDPKTGSSGVHVAQTPKAFTVRVPWPEPGEHVEIASADGTSKGMWP